MMKGEFANLCGTERLQQHFGEELNSPVRDRVKKGMAVPTSTDLNNCPLIYNIISNMSPGQ